MGNERSAGNLHAMTRVEQILASRFLALAADEFSNHGCNDLDMSLLDGITHDEKLVLEASFNEWNHSDNKEDWMKLETIGDASLMHYLSATLGNE